MTENTRPFMKPFSPFQVNKHISVLYIEDELDIQEEFADILSIYVDEIHIASNGKEGLAKLYDSHPDIIITDIQMPVMNGLEMIKHIRKDNQDIPIIITSAFNDTDYLLSAIGLGVEHYILKPIMIDKLEKCLDILKDRLIQKRELEAYKSYLEERIEKEVLLREAKEALLIEKNKSSEVGQMVSIIAHQWKQPLHYLNLLIEDLGMEYDYHPLSKEYIQDFIQKGTTRVRFLTETMDNFLHFYKNEADTSQFLVSKVTQEISMFLDMTFKAQGINIQTRVLNDFKLIGIRNEFQQVILNLINNAKEAFKEQKRDDANIIIEISNDKDKGTIIIQDNAGGIKQERIEDIFELEYTTKQNGNGIGLYLVKKIVEQGFKGSIDVVNSDSGACFTLQFELSEEDNI